MTKEQMREYRDRLRAMADRVDGTMSRLEEEVRTPTGGQAAGGLSNAPLHLGDVGTDAFSQELDATLLENEAYIRDEVIAALQRIDRGTYGRCENCGRDIVAERIDALPYTRYCTACAGRLQAGRAVNLNEGRPQGWLGAPGREGPNKAGAADRVVGKDLGADPRDVHAAGTPGGGTAVGGLAGTNLGTGAPDVEKLDEAMGSGKFDADIEQEEEGQAYAGPSGGAVGGTPANKRARGGLAHRGVAPRSEPEPRGGSQKKAPAKPRGKSAAKSAGKTSGKAPAKSSAKKPRKPR